MHKPNIDREALPQTLKDMVSIDSVNPSLVKDAAGETEIADYLQNWMKALGPVSYTHLTLPTKA